MATVAGVVVLALSLLCWGGQAVSAWAPATAVRLSLTEAADTVEPVYSADIRGEAWWDTLTLWTMVVAGALLIAGSPGWAYFGLVGGGMYIYFAGRGVFTRTALQRRGFRIGSARNVRLGYAFLTIWGVMGLTTVIAAVNDLARS